MNNEPDLTKKKNTTSLLIGVALLIIGLILPFVAASLSPGSIYRSANAFLISGLVNLIGIISVLIGFLLSIKYSILLGLKPLIIVINIIRLIYGLFLVYSFMGAIYIYGQSQYYAGLMVLVSVVFLIIAVVLVIKSFILFFKKNLGVAY